MLHDTIKFKDLLNVKRITDFNNPHCTKMKFSITDFFSKCDQIRRKMRIWSHLLKTSLMENLIFVQSELKLRRGGLSWALKSLRWSWVKTFLSSPTFLKPVKFALLVWKLVNKYLDIGNFEKLIHQAGKNNDSCTI